MSGSHPGAVPRVISRPLGRLGREVRSASANIRAGVPWSRQLQGWRHGFYAENLAIYDIERFGFDAYVSDFARATWLGKINHNRYLLDDKLTSSLYLERVGVPTPQVFAHKEAGSLVFLEAVGQQEGLDGLLHRHGRLIVKPRDGSSGNRITILEHSGADQPVVHGAASTVDEALRGRMIVSECLTQHEYAASIFPGTVNTVRVITLRDPEDDVPYPAVAFHKFGTTRSAPVDNYAQGGLVSPIDVSTGELGAVGSVSENPVAQVTWTDHHPESGARVAGTTVPHWDQVLETARRAADSLPGCYIVGWDIVVTPDGPSVIEGNNRPGHVYTQMFKPWLLDDRDRRFFAHHRRTS